MHRLALGDGAVAAGNRPASPDVVDAMLAAFEHRAAGALPARLLHALNAVLAAGGEAGPVHSAGLTFTHPTAGWSDTDLRVDGHDDPVGELGRLWALWQPQRADYITRGLHPASAPAYGVPGDQ